MHLSTLTPEELLRVASARTALEYALINALKVVINERDDAIAELPSCHPGETSCPAQP